MAGSWLNGRAHRKKQVSIRVHGYKGFGNQRFDGLVKLKLVHSRGVSLLIPDQIYLEAPTVWFQPKTFLPCVLQKDDSSVRASLYCDIADGHTLQIDIEDNGLVRSFDDSSFLYRCMMLGPTELVALATGEWSMIDDRPHLRLYHHTSEAASDSITKSQEFWPSAWNIQGNRKLKNVGYAYFTPLKKIKDNTDLAAIAMSPNRTLHYLRDGATDPGRLPANWRSTKLSQDVLEVQVYWSAPDKRDHTVAVDVDATTLAPHHVWRHDTRQVWYEVVCPEILRVGLEPGVKLQFDTTGRVLARPCLRRFSYMVIGDATTLDGLGAPLDEENTTQTFKVHDAGAPPLELWFENANTDQYSRLTTTEQEFENP